MESPPAYDTIVSNKIISGKKGDVFPKKSQSVENCESKTDFFIIEISEGFGYYFRPAVDLKVTKDQFTLRGDCELEEKPAKKTSHKKGDQLTKKNGILVCEESEDDYYFGVSRGFGYFFEPAIRIKILEKLISLGADCIVTDDLQATNKIDDDNLEDYPMGPGDKLTIKQGPTTTINGSLLSNSATGVKCGFGYIFQPDVDLEIEDDFIILKTKTRVTSHPEAKKRIVFGNNVTSTRSIITKNFTNLNLGEYTQNFTMPSMHQYNNSSSNNYIGELVTSSDSIPQKSKPVKSKAINGSGLATADYGTYREPITKATCAYGKFYGPVGESYGDYCDFYGPIGKIYGSYCTAHQDAGQIIGDYNKYKGNVGSITGRYTSKI